MAKINSYFFVLSVLSTFAGTMTALAQSARSGITMQGGAEGGAGSLPRDSFGRSCLDVEAAARAKTVDPKMMDHIVSIKNNCPKFFKLKVCYLSSESCSHVDVQPYKRVDTILGSMRSVSFFKYTIVQR